MLILKQFKKANYIYVYLQLNLRPSAFSKELTEPANYLRNMDTLTHPLSHICETSPTWHTEKDAQIHSKFRCCSMSYWGVVAALQMRTKPKRRSRSEFAVAKIESGIFAITRSRLPLRKNCYTEHKRKETYLTAAKIYSYI